MNQYFKNGDWVNSLAGLIPIVLQLILFKSVESWLVQFIFIFALTFIFVIFLFIYLTSILKQLNYISNVLLIEYLGINFIALV